MLANVNDWRANGLSALWVLAWPAAPSTPHASSSRLSPSRVLTGKAQRISSDSSLAAVIGALVGIAWALAVYVVALALLSTDWVFVRAHALVSAVAVAVTHYQSNRIDRRVELAW